MWTTRERIIVFRMIRSWTARHTVDLLEDADLGNRRSS